MQGFEGPDDAFEANGPLGFLLGPYGIEWEWRGVFQAVAIQFADLWKAELADALPGGAGRRWDDNDVQDAFVESVRWRLISSFSDRTIELLNRLDRVGPDAIDLLLELSLVNEHPWNAELLHTNLTHLRMPERDAWWTTAINQSAEDEGQPADRIVNWALGAAIRRVAPETLELALVVLGWLLTSTNRRLRDRATKAVTEILLVNERLFLGFLERFQNVDDIYVLERVLAAGAGACLRDPSLSRLTEYSPAVYRSIFVGNGVPRHILLRDYARLIIELANEKGALSKDCDIDRARPPYGATPPRFGLKKDKVEARAKSVGDRSIFLSCTGWGDFGRYVIKSRIRDFTRLRLSGPKPLTKHEAYRLFREKWTDADDLTREWMDLVDNIYIRKQVPLQVNPEPLAIIAEAKNLKELLPPPARRAFERDVGSYLRNRAGWHLPKGSKLARIDTEQAQLWVANRAVALGWTSDRFGHDASRGDDRVHGSRTERMGKKYQWIAYHDLLSRLCDNYWIAEEWGTAEGARAYDTPPRDVEFSRNIDPTIPPADEDEEFSTTLAHAPTPPRLAIVDVDPSKMRAWVFHKTLAGDRLRLALCPDVKAPEEWVSLYRFTSAKTEYEGNRPLVEAPFRQDDFHFLTMIAVPKVDRAAFVRHAKKARIDFHEWLQRDLTDGPFLYEAGVRSTWPDEQWVTSNEWHGPEFRYVEFSRGYHWERHLDGSLPDGFSIQVPNPWLLKMLGVAADPHAPGRYIDPDGALTIVSNRGQSNGYCLARREYLLRMLDAEGLAPLWAGIGERTAWPKPSKNEGPRVRWNGLLWLTMSGPRSVTWQEET